MDGKDVRDLKIGDKIRVQIKVVEVVGDEIMYELADGQRGRMPIADLPEE